MNILYNRLFNLAFRHDYFKDGIARGVYLQPTKPTARILGGGRMLFKTIPKGITVLYRTLDDEITPFVDLGKDVRLTFGLEIENFSEFLNITDLDISSSEKYTSSNILYFRNDPAAASSDPDSPEVLQYELIDFMRGSLFSFEFGLASSPSQVLFRLYDENDALISAGTDVDGNPLSTTLTLDITDNGRYIRQVDLRNKSGGKHTIVIRNTGDTTDLLRKVVYVDDNLNGKAISGIVDIVYDTAENRIYGDTEEYTIQFDHKSTVWKYLIVNKNNIIDFTTDNVSIHDAGTPLGPYITNTFSVSGSVPNNDIRVNGLDTVVIKSDVAIPFYEIPKTNLQLKKNSMVQPVLGDLPNPSHSGVVKEDAGSLESEIYVYI